MMASSTLLDYALFQLTPTRTRCDLVLFYGGKSEKLASGLFEPFICHLKFLKDEISKGGYSIKLRPPNYNGAPWFTKGTFERFVRFVSTPAVLERFVSLEREISQIESSVHANELPSSNAASQLDEGIASAVNASTRKSSDFSKAKDGLAKSEDAIPENSKIQLQRLLETRKALLRKEQAMAYARGLVAGFDLDNTDDLISFADTFGASRLREACINFKELWKKKHGDGLWMEELAAMQARPPSDFALLGTSGIVLTNDLNTVNPNITLNLTNGGLSTGDSVPIKSDSTASNASLDNKKDDNMIASQQIPSSATKVQMAMPWANQIPPYMYNFQGHIPQMPPYQGYPYPNMPPIPPHYPNNMHWPPSFERSPAKKDRHLNKKDSNDSGDDGNTESTDSEVGSDSDSRISHDRNHSSGDASQRKKQRKKSSKTVVIRNINYITPTRRKGEKNEVLGSSSSDEDEFIDEDSLRQQVDEAVGSLGKLQKSKSSNRKTKGGHKANHIGNGSDDSPAQDSDGALISNASEGGKINDSWNTFQNILMAAKEPFVNTVETLHSADAQNGDSIVRSHRDGVSLPTNPAMDLESEKLPQQRKAAGDSFIITQRDGGIEDRAMMDDFEKAQSVRPIIKKRDSFEKDLMISQRIEEPETGIGRSLSSATESPVIKPPKGEDWFIIDQGRRPENQDAAGGETIFNGDYVSALTNNQPNADKTRKDVLIDDSFMVHDRPPVDDLYNSQWKTDISMAADLTLSSQAENGTVRDNKEAVDLCEPDDLCMVLERESGLFESTRESWTTDPGIDISFMEADRRSSRDETGDHAQKKLLSSGGDSNAANKNVTNGRKVPAKEAKSKIAPGSIRKSKPDMLSTGKKSSVMSRTISQKSKLEKEEEMRKKMEELVIQRQKRIAERTAAAGSRPATSGKSPLESRTAKGSIKVGKK